MTAAETQTLLRPAEALLVYAVQDDQSYLWVLRSPDQAALRVLPFGRAALAERVTALRRGLDPRPGHLEPFEVAAAHALYQDILAPAAELLAGADHLIVVPDGPLESLPFAVLVTAPPPERPAGTFGRYRQAVWLGTQRAISVLPGVSALRALRATVAQPPGAEPFLGYGQPVLTGDRVPAAPAEGTAARAAAAPAPGGRRTADVERVRRLEPLTGTEDLLRTIATALGADPAGAVVTGADATVPRLRQAPLDRYRVLALATHGLLVDEARRLGLDEPGLVLTPPEVGSAEDDGVLTVGDITQLRLNADWVLLTACNTAASDGTPGAEGLSGLARAFFYAGARSLLVSHWSVNRDAAIALVTRLFPAAGQGGGKAAALQAAMTVLIADRNHPEYAHPAYWAPFIVVGEGG